MISRNQPLDLVFDAEIIAFKNLVNLILEPAENLALRPSFKRLNGKVLHFTIIVIYHIDPLHIMANLIL